MGGKNAAMLFPSNISPSVVGVAKSGSRLFSTFSPTMLYEAIAVGRTAEEITKKKENAFNNVRKSVSWNASTVSSSENNIPLGKRSDKSKREEYYSVDYAFFALD